MLTDLIKKNEREREKVDIMTCWINICIFT